MVKIIIVILCTLSVNLALQLISNKIKKLIKKSIVAIPEEDRPTKVRTVKELERRSKECVVLDFIGIVEQYGFTAEEHTVTTADGYILKIHRVSGSLSSPKKDGKPVIFINNALLTDSDFYVLNGPDFDLVYLLADKGYDIWLGNIRGTSYSRSHVKYSPLDSEFWDFSLDEQSLIDTPAFIDFVLEETGQKKLTYLGFSMGTTESYMLLSSKPEYNEKINLLISIAPVVFADSTMNELLKELIRITLETAGKLNVHEILPQSCTMGKAADKFCSAPKPNLCRPFIQMFCDADNINISHDLPRYIKHTPAGSSYRTIEHYKQIIDSGGKFQKYDYSYQKLNKALNIEKYNQTTPPAYNVSLVTVPVIIYWASNDIFDPVETTKLLKNHLPNVVDFHLIPDEKFNHLDFFWNVKAKKLVYDPLIDIMTRQLIRGSTIVKLKKQIK